ncbi:SDR family oxidoreductase [uncultured Brevundimonas sp.]|uniref:SDR family oxidoreductase n=1 Tax=uncultured Brevundimonas sp. TaxID=213418 RepID=UPI0030EEFC05|tara:strand:+ start:47039 stop:47902 length:864 start_codon:yes stop_codon:yes gene_type:complete
MTATPILVTGATGTIGSEVVKQLVEGGHRVRALVRDPVRAAGLGDAVEIVVADLSRPETLPAAFAGVDSVFVVSNGLDIAALEGNAYDAALKAGVKRIVKLSGRHLDADFMQGTPLASNQNASEQRLRQLGIAWTIIRPGFFASNFLLFMDRRNGVVALPVGDGKDTPTDPRDIAAVAVLALTRPGHENKIYEITGPDFVSYADMVEKIAMATGLPVKLVDMPSAVVRDGMVAAGVPLTQASGLMRYFEGVKGGRVYPPTQTIAELLGRAPRSLDDWVRDHLSALAG